MSLPLFHRPELKPVIGLLKKEGWAVPLFALFFIRGMHGLPEAAYVIFGTRKSDISSYGAEFSRHDMWIVHSGLMSIISAILITFTLYRWIRFYRETSRQLRMPVKS